jgi:hypothetical protein
MVSAISIRAVTASLVIALIGLSGCGSGSDNPSEAQLEAARKAGEQVAHERDRVNSLQKQVHSLKHQAKHGTQTVVVHHDNALSSPSEDSGSAVLRTFHAPSGNVSCEILSDGALCTVGPINTTFSFSNGESAQIASGSVLSEGGGELAPYGSTVSEGSIACTIPQSSEPHGIICTDSNSGHGFEASRVSTRQHAY